MSALELTDPPAWSLVSAKPKTDARAPSATLAAWVAAVPSGKPSKVLRKAAEVVQATGTSHDAMLAAVGVVVGAGSRGEPGAARLLEKARERYIEGRPDRARDWDNAVDGSVRHHGLPPVTFKLSKAERKALKSRGKAPEPDEHDERVSPFLDVAAIIAGGAEPPVPDAGSQREDGLHLLYAGKVSVAMGPPESAKTLMAVAMAADTMRRGGRVAWVDTDHNGPEATVARFLACGIEPDVLASLLLLSVPEDADEVRAVVAALKAEPVDFVAIDSVGEVLPMFGADSNSADDYSRVNREVFAALALTGAAVLLIEHVAKTAANTGYASGTGAKKRAIDGAMYELAVIEKFRPGHGGAASLKIRKDRHGGIYRHTEGETAAVFRLDSRADQWTWAFYPPHSADERADEQAGADIAFVLALDPFPTSRRALQAVTRATGDKGWGSERAHAALAAARLRRMTTFPTTASTTDN